MKADTSEANIPTVEELAANPERLKELRQQCKTDRPKLGDVLCNRVASHAQAVLWRRRNAVHTTEGTA